MGNWFSDSSFRKRRAAQRRRPWGAFVEPLEPRSMCAGLPVATANAVTDDRYEPNDSMWSSASFSTTSSAQTFTNLAMADRADWYRFTLPAPGKSTDQVSIAFQHARGDLDLALYNSRGSRVRLSMGTQNSERISLQGLAAGTYYVVAYGYAGAANPNYSLTLTVSSGSSSTPTTGGTTTTSSPPPTGGTTTTSPTSTTTLNTTTSVASTPLPTSSSSTTASGFDIQFSFSGLTTTQQAIFEQAARKWESIIVGDLPNALYNGRAVDDLLISASSVAIDGRGSVLGQAGPDRFRSGSQLPYHGRMEFDSADLASMQADGTLLGVITHEIGHVLGIGTLWSSKGLIVGANTSSPRYVGARGVAAYNQLFGLSGSSIPVESGGGAGTRDAHWSENVMGTELMTGYVGPGSSMPVSRITVASLADLGYTVNYAAADTYTPPYRSTRTTSTTNTSGSTSLSFANLAAPSTSQAIPPSVVPYHRAVDALFERSITEWWD